MIKIEKVKYLKGEELEKVLSYFEKPENTELLLYYPKVWLFWNTDGKYESWLIGFENRDGNFSKGIYVNVVTDEDEFLGINDRIRIAKRILSRFFKTK